MFLKNIKHIHFFARELRLPLFWMMDKRQPMLSDNMLIFYKNKVMHFYHLNNRELKAADIGYNFFTNAEYVERYEAQVNEILEIIAKTEVDFKTLSIGKLSDEAFEKLFHSFLKKLIDYVNIYGKTEEMYWPKIEAEANTHKKIIKKVGKLRLSLREKGQGMFYLLLGVLLKELSKRMGVKVADLFLYTDDEIANLFKGKKVRADVIATRSKGYAVLALKKKYRLVVGDEFKKSFNEIVRNKKSVSDICGQVAMKGHATGRVRVLMHNRRDISTDVLQFKKGEILVTEMTRPDVIMACRKAAAIITDEGGIASHAAIIARELKIPAVIGTKIATQVLKDGDMVKVDAITGVVKIIK